MNKLMIFSLTILLSSSAFAIGEANYKAEYTEKILPLIKSYNRGTFKGPNNVGVSYATYASNPSATRCLVILPGRTEPIEKYAEVVHSLDNGSLKGQFQFILMDHRGQGSSQRMLKAGDEEKGYVDNFENYALDLKILLDTVVAQKNCSEKLLLAHSLGAGISADFLQKYPEYFDRAALSSPMLKIQTKPYKYVLARAMVAASVLAGQGKKFGPGQKVYNPTRDFENNDFTSSPARYEMAKDMFDLFPQTRLGGVTNKWLNEIMSGTKKIRKHYSDITIPLRVFHAGFETYSEKSEMIRLCDEAPHCIRTYLPESKHEVLMDRDVNRDVVISELEKFFK